MWLRGCFHEHPNLAKTVSHSGNGGPPEVVLLRCLILIRPLARKISHKSPICATLRPPPWKHGLRMLLEDEFMQRTT